MRAGLHAADVRLYDFSETNLSIPVSDGVVLRATLMKPMPFEVGQRFPAVVFIHGWGNTRNGDGGFVKAQRDFAADGYTVLAYDVRGFGESGGMSTLAGPREMQDMREVIDFLVNATAWNGRLGVTGYSYGAGHAWWALVHDERVTTAVPHYGWIDLADGLAPGSVPKHGWISALLLIGAFGGGNYDPVIYDWARRAAARDGLDEVLDALRERSTFRNLTNVTKPVLLVEGTGETLFPQALSAYALLENAKQRNVFFFPGGHGVHNEAAYDHTRLWFDRWLKLEDSGVDAWPAITMPLGDSEATFGSYPVRGTREATYFFADATPADGEGTLEANATKVGPDGRARYTGSARSGVFDDPAGVTDASGFRAPRVPSSLRSAPNEAMLFRGEPLKNASLMIGEPRVNVTLAPSPTGLQIIARLYAEAPDGTSRLLARGGLDPTPLDTEQAVEFPLVRALARIGAGERLVLILAGDDVSYTAPYPRPFTSEAVFGGESGARLVVPMAPA